MAGETNPAIVPDAEAQKSGSLPKREGPDGDDNRAVVIGKKALLSALIAIALNPVGIAVGYFVGKWLQGPRLSIKKVIVDPSIEANLPPELVNTLNNLEQGSPNTPLWRLSPEERKNFYSGALSSEMIIFVTSDAEIYKGLLLSDKKNAEDNLKIVEGWKRGEPLVVHRISILNEEELHSESPQQIAERSPKALSGIYSSALDDINSRLDQLALLLDFLKKNAHNRSGDAFVKVGVLNSGDSEGVVYPEAVLTSAAGEIDLEASQPPTFIAGVTDTGGYVVVPAHSFRQINYHVSASSRSDARDNWRKLIKASSPGEITVEIHTGSGSFRGGGNLPL
jgi:hypothetical protein